MKLRRFSKQDSKASPATLLVATLLTMCFSSSIMFGQEPRIDLSQIANALRAEDATKAHLLCLGALSLQAKDPRIWALDGVALDKLGQDEKALRAFRSALKLQATYRPALEGEAQILYRRGDPSGIPVLEALLKLIPNDPLSLAMLGSLQFKVGNLAEAQANFGRAEPVLTQNPYLLMQYGVASADLGQFSEAVQAFAKALTLRPTDAAIRFNLALGEWRVGDPQGALVTLKPLLSEAGSTSDVHSVAAELYVIADDIPNAVEQLRQAIQLNPKNVENYLAFAALSYRYRSYQAGIDLLSVGVAQLPQSAALHIARGTLYAQLSAFDKAFEEFDRANKLDPKEAFGTVAGAVADAQQQDPTKAIASYRTQILQHPDEPLAHFLLAEALFEQDPAANPTRTEEVLKEASAAVRLDNSLVQAHDLLAKIYIRLGRNLDAIAEANRALAIDPSDEQALYHLLLASRRGGDRSLVNAIADRLAKAHEASIEASNKHRNFEISIPR